MGFAGTASEVKAGQKWVTSASCVQGHLYWNYKFSEETLHLGAEGEGGYMFPAVTRGKGHKCHDSMSLSIHKHHCIIATYNKHNEKRWFFSKSQECSRIMCIKRGQQNWQSQK